MARAHPAAMTVNINISAPPRVLGQDRAGRIITIVYLSFINELRNTCSNEDNKAGRTTIVIFSR